MRRIWLKKIDNDDTWDLLPQDRTGHYDATITGCPLVNIKGLGYQQTITQNQVETEYFISNILSKNQAITGIMLFRDDEHIKEFQDFIGDFRNQFYLFYSPSGEFEPEDQLSAIFYKRAVITQVDKTEKDEFGWYQISTTISLQDDVWSRNVAYGVEGLSSVGQALVYPYTYPYVIGGRNALAIDFNNDGREVGCTIKIKNNSGSNLSNIEWYLEREYIDYYGVLHQHADVQRSKWNLTLSDGSELTVDSNPLTQEAKVTYSDNTSQNVIDLQEPSWDYINFVRVNHGKNRIVFYIENVDADVTFTYREQKELI